MIRLNIFCCFVLFGCSIEHAGLLPPDAGRVDVSMTCFNGSTRECGGVGSCLPGEQLCEQSVWGECIGATVPSPEVCDDELVDEDCDGEVNEDCPCSPGQVRPCGSSVGACTAGTSACISGEWGECVGATAGTEETCDDLDNDCDGSTDEGTQTLYYRDNDNDGAGDPENRTMACTLPENHSAMAGDCDDSDPERFEGNTEVCDGVDNDCDGIVDNGLARPFFADVDEDTFGDPESSMMGCTLPVGFVENSDDCDDTSAAIRPGAIEVCDTVDNNCNGLRDEGNACPSSTCTTHELGAHVYLFCESRVAWTAARSFCAGRGGGGYYDLASIDDMTEQGLIATIALAMGGSNSWWIGLNDQDTENAFRWINGSGASYRNWVGDSTPPMDRSKNCVLTTADGWVPERCTTPTYFICEEL